MGDLSLLEAVAVLGACFAGTLLQGALGFGFAFAAVPALLLVVPEGVPATSLLLAAPIVVTMGLRERHAIDVRGVAEMTAGRLPGTVAGAWLVSALGLATLTGVVGALLVLAVLMSVVTPAAQGRGPATRVLAGFASGVMGTAGAIGGPALGLAYQGRPGPELRASLAVAFGVGVVLSLLALWVTGEVGRTQLVLALELLPAVGLGLLASRFVAGRLDGRRLRPAVLAFAGVAGVAAIVRSLV